MLSRFGMAPRKPGLSAEQFQEHWRTSHARVVRGMEGLARYWQNHAVLRDGEPLLPWPGFDACAQIDAESLPAMDRAFSASHYQTVVREDERRFIDVTQGGYMLGERVLAEGEVSGRGVRLMTFMRLASMGSAAALGEALLEGGLPPSAVGRECFLAFGGGTLGGQRFSLFDALEILWFAEPGEAERHAFSSAARERRTRLAGLVRGTERLIARVNKVI